MKIAVVLGTRPEIIKVSPVIRELQTQQAVYYVVHTGQHYSRALDGAIFEQLKLPQPKYNLNVGSGSHAEQTARILVGMEKVLQSESPDVLLAEGDTNSTFASSMAASKLHIRVGHIEAGLRSYDRSMPEEINRILADHCSDYLFAPTEKAKTILLGEGVSEKKIFVTGNTIVDAVFQNLGIARRAGNAFNRLGLSEEGYFLVTLHRQENVDSPKRFASILAGLEQLATTFELPIVYPIHPRSEKMMKQFDLSPGNIRLIEPLDFLSFLQLESAARLILTDSGGVQEEACILKVPCVTLRDNTERPETIEIGSNMLAGTSPARILECARLMLNRQRNWANPFGDGKASERIIKIVMEHSGG